MSKINLDDYGLSTDFIGKNFILLDEVNSTNTYIIDNLDSLVNGCTVAAKYQNSGKGRLDRKWYTEKDNALTFSVLLKTSMSTEKKLLIVFAAACAVKLMIKKLYNITPHVKWPNDIYIENKKVCGILCENKNDNIIIGIGINVNQDSFAEEIKDIASSLWLITGIKKDILEVLSITLNFLESTIKTLEKEGFYPIKEEILKNFYLQGKNVQVQSGKKKLEGKVKGMDDNGYLILDIKGKEKKINSGDVHICF